MCLLRAGREHGARTTHKSGVAAANVLFSAVQRQPMYKGKQQASIASPHYPRPSRAPRRRLARDLPRTHDRYSCGAGIPSHPRTSAIMNRPGTEARSLPFLRPSLPSLHALSRRKLGVVSAWRTPLAPPTAGATGSTSAVQSRLLHRASVSQTACFSADTTTDCPEHVLCSECRWGDAGRLRILDRACFPFAVVCCGRCYDLPLPTSSNCFSSASS